MQLRIWTWASLPRASRPPCAFSSASDGMRSQPLPSPATLYRSIEYSPQPQSLLHQGVPVSRGHPPPFPPSRPLCAGPRSPPRAVTEIDSTCTQLQKTPKESCYTAEKRRSTRSSALDRARQRDARYSARDARTLHCRRRTLRRPLVDLGNPNVPSRVAISTLHSPSAAAACPRRCEPSTRPRRRSRTRVSG